MLDRVTCCDEWLLYWITSYCKVQWQQLMLLTIVFIMWDHVLRTVQQHSGLLLHIHTDRLTQTHRDIQRNTGKHTDIERQTHGDILEQIYTVTETYWYRHRQWLMQWTTGQLEKDHKETQWTTLMEDWHYCNVDRSQWLSITNGSTHQLWTELARWLPQQRPAEGWHQRPAVWTLQRTDTSVRQVVQQCTANQSGTNHEPESTAIADNTHRQTYQLTYTHNRHIYTTTDDNWCQWRQSSNKDEQL